MVELKAPSNGGKSSKQLAVSKPPSPPAILTGPAFKVVVRQKPTSLENFFLVLIILLLILAALLLIGGFVRAVGLGGWRQAGMVSITGSPGGVTANGIPQIAWTPDRLIVTKGEEITLAVTAYGMNYHFVLPVAGIDTVLIPGKTKEFHFAAKETGSFTFGSSGMAGELIILPR